MRYKILGRSGLRVSELALGTMTFGEGWGWGASKEESRRIFDLFVDAGGNFVDTADLYVDGTSEEFVGEFVKGKRERVVLATKFNSRSAGSGDPNATGNHRKHMVQALEASLRRLGTDYVDVYYVHTPDWMTPADELMRALDDLVRAGKVLYAGVSDFPAWSVARANTLADQKGWSPFVVTTIEYGLHERTPERELLPMARELDLGVTAWSPTGGGLLSGKYNGGGTDGGGGFRRLDEFRFTELSERNLRIAAETEAVAGEVGCTPQQLALAWVRTRGVIPIVGAHAAKQMEENLGSLDVDIEEVHLSRLEEASRVGLGFPHEFLVNTREVAYGGMLERIDTHRPNDALALLRAADGEGG